MNNPSKGRDEESHHRYEIGELFNIIVAYRFKSFFNALFSFISKSFLGLQWLECWTQFLNVYSISPRDTCSMINNNNS